MIDNEKLLHAGIDAARKGNRDEATKLLTQAVQANPRLEQAWLWLGFCRYKAEEREYCFQRVIKLNPNNQEARRQLALLNKTPTARPPFVPTIPAKKTESSLPTKKEIIDSQQVRPNESTLFGSGKVSATPATTTLKQRRKASPWVWLTFLGIVAFCGITITAVWMFNNQITELIHPTISNLPSPSPEIPTSAPPISTPNYTTVFEPTACTFSAPEDAKVDCGFVIVSEDRNGDLSDTIKIAVVIYRSANPAPDPVIFITGGPGGQAIFWSRDFYTTVVAPLVSYRDFIAFDPRGVGLSQPRLDCIELGQTYLKDLQGKLPPGDELPFYEGAMLNCYDDLNRQGVNPSAYNSITTAADVRDIILALGYQQANLYGISYGTRISQIAMRNHPEVVRTAILDSVVPVDANLIDGTSASDQDVLGLLFTECANNPQCSKAYPNLEQVFSETVQKLDIQPPMVEITLSDNETSFQQLSGAKFTSAIWGSMKYARTLSMIPQAIYRAHSGDYSAIKSALRTPSDTVSDLTLGVYVSFNCREQIFASTPEVMGDVLFKLCGLWNVDAPAPGENDPVISDIPTLILTGKYDSTTPPKLAAQVKQGLSNSYLMEFGGQAHAPSTTDPSGCSQTIINAFLQNPTVEPNRSCLEANNQVNFILPYTGNPPLDLIPAAPLYGSIQFKFPVGWADIGNGYFGRRNSAVDFTSIGFQRANIEEQGWIDWLMTEFRPAGFDTNPTQNGTRKANGFLWTLYKTTSRGHPIDLAFAKYENDTLMILLATHADEHDALFDTVFIPIIDSVMVSK